MAKRPQIEVEGMKEMREQLRGLAPNLSRNIMRNTIHGVAGVVRDELKRKVKKRSRALEKSIKAVRRRGEPDAPVSEVRGGGRAPYAIMLEFGTSKTRAQPYIVPTTERIRPQMPEIMREQFAKKLIDQIVKRAFKGSKNAR